MDLSNDLIVPYSEQIIWFMGEWVDTRGYVDLKKQSGTDRDAKELRVRYIVVEANTSYNVLIDRPCLNSLGAIVLTSHLAMKFPSDRGTICTIQADQKIARECYMEGLKFEPFIPHRKIRRLEVPMMT